MINPNLPNGYALNWGSSAAIDGTPGRANSILQTNLAPIITSVAHSPVLPHRTDPVTVSARIVDEQLTGTAATLFYRNATTATPPAFTGVPMFDDGAHNDGLAGDGIYAAILPAQANGTVIEFYLQARDSAGNMRTYPNVIPPANSSRTANLLYQVDEGVYSGSQPIYRVIMTEMERQELYEIGRGCPSMDSDAQMNATWITMDGVVSGGTTTQVRYNVGVRNRGHGTRPSNPNNYHVNIPGDRPWKNTTGINLNSQYAHSQVLGSAMFRRGGVPMAESRAVQVRINSTNLMSLPYDDGRPVDTTPSARMRPTSNTTTISSSAFSRSIRMAIPTAAFAIRPFVIPPATAWQISPGTAPTTPSASYTNAYFKQNNFLQNDWSDLIDLIAVLNSQTAINLPTTSATFNAASMWMNG